MRRSASKLSEGSLRRAGTFGHGVIGLEKMMERLIRFW